MMQYPNILSFLENSHWLVTEAHAQTIKSIIVRIFSGKDINIPKHEHDERAAYVVDGGERMDLRTGSYSVFKVGSTAVVPILGTISKRMNMLTALSGGVSTDMLTSTFNKLALDNSINSVVLDIDSPGGYMDGLEEARRALLSLRNKKSVFAVSNNLMASAAYYIGSAATEIIGAPNSQIGSVGVWSMAVNESKRLDKKGIEVFIVRSGKNKAVPHPAEPFDEAGLERIREGNEMAFTSFLGAVSENRNISMSKLTVLIEGGKLFEATDAIKAQLADRIGTLDEVVAEANDLADAQEAISSFGSVMSDASETIVALEAEVDSLQQANLAYESQLTDYMSLIETKNDSALDKDCRLAVDAAVRDFRIVPNEADNFHEMGMLYGLEALEIILSNFEPHPELRDGVMNTFSINDQPVDKYAPKNELQIQIFKQFPSLRKHYDLD